MKFKVVTLRGDAKIRVGGQLYGPIDFERAPNLEQSWDEEYRALRVTPKNPKPGDDGVLIPLESIFTASYELAAEKDKKGKAA